MRLLLAYFVILVFLSLNPWLRISANKIIGFVTWDLLGHAAAYGLLSLLMLMALWRRERSVVTMLAVWLFCGLLGVLFEYCQYWFTSSRQFSLNDAAANGLGAMLGIIMFWLMQVYLFLKGKTSSA